MSVSVYDILHLFDKQCIKYSNDNIKSWTEAVAGVRNLLRIAISRITSVVNDLHFGVLHCMAATVGDVENKILLAFET